MRLPGYVVGSLASLALAFTVAVGQAQGPVGVPSTFWGTVAVDGASVPAGTEVRGFIDGRDCTQLGDNYRTVAVDLGVSSYAIEVVHESQVPGCGAEGRMVTFMVGGVLAAQSVPWAFGPTRIDLTVGGDAALPLPAATSPDPAGLTATATAAAAFTPLAGTPPLDDVDPREIIGGAGGSSTPGVPSSGSGSGATAFLPLATAVIAIAAAGAGGGWWLARRSARRPG